MKKKLNSQLVDLVAILHRGGYRSVDAMAKLVQIPQRAVISAIERLQQHGVQIDFQQEKGYALQEPLILLDEARIKDYLQDDPLDVIDPSLDIELFETIDSTNQYLKSFKQHNAIKICVAEQQTKGKGRLGRDWYSPFAKNIYLSCLYLFKKEVGELAGLSLVVGLAILRALQEVDENALKVKWPNDILCGNQKVAGVLIELQATQPYECQVIIGMGVNVNMQQEATEISQPFTSLREINGEYLDRNKIIARMIQQLFFYLREFDRYGFNKFMQEWMSRDALLGQQINLKAFDKIYAGTMMGVDSQGQLLLETETKEVLAFSVGDALLLRIA